MTDDALESALQRLEEAIRDAASSKPSGAGEHSREQHAAILAREPAARKAIDGMCRAWVAGGELPAPTDQVTQSLFHARLVEAHALGAWLRENGFGAPDVRVEPLLELLLIEYWKTFVAPGARASFSGPPAL